MSKLREIFEWKGVEVEQAKAAVPLGELRRMVGDAPPVRPFLEALRQSPNPVALIAEVKKASPSKGLIRQPFDPIQVADAYRGAGADCLSVLTDERYFQGSKENLELARAASGLPCLRKDFIFDEYQVYESRAWGADCILLITGGLVAETTKELGSLARGLGMDVLVEVHSREELDVALDLGADLIGVNNRNLADMTTSLVRAEELLPLIGSNALAVAESAIGSYEDVERVREAGARAVLIGTTFCAASDIATKVREVMRWPTP